MPRCVSIDGFHCQRPSFSARSEVRLAIADVVDEQVALTGPHLLEDDVVGAGVEAADVGTRSVGR